jgi:adenylate cyclase
MSQPAATLAPPADGSTGRHHWRAVIVQSSLKEAQNLAGYFNRRQDQLWLTVSAREAAGLVQKHRADLLVVDLHLPGNDWLDLLRLVRQDLPSTQVIVTNRLPDLRREILAKEQGVQVFLRQPFTRQWVERALTRLSGNASPAGSEQAVATQRAALMRLPSVRTPVRLKITVPYVLLGLAFLAGAAYLLSRYVIDTFEERFESQVLDVGRLASDWMVQEENRLLATLRLVAHTQGMAGALLGNDAETLRSLAYPIALNDRQDAVEILDMRGTSVLSLRHQAGGGLEAYAFTRGDTLYRDWDFVQAVLDGAVDDQGDKFAGMVRAPWGDYFYVSGPILDTDGNLAGVILVGSTTESLVRQIRQMTLGQITLYDLRGQALATTHNADLAAVEVPAAQAAQVLERQDEGSLLRDVTVDSLTYTEVIGPWQARNGADLGLVGAALARNNLARPTAITRVQAFAFVGLAFLIVVGLGLYLSSLITRPLTQMVHASTQVAEGNLEVKVDTRGDDEVAVLAHAFNYMVTGLQEGFIYRDLLGRTVSPEVREQLRQSFASGNLKLEGQNVVATVLMSDIRDFTALSENEEPTTILAWLNEYFSGLVPIVTANGGVVDKFEGDALLSFFGILPQPLPPKDAAYHACRAAVAILQSVEQLNARRMAEGHPAFTTGIGINTGLVTAGGLGASDRLNYTIIGDAVNTTARLQSFSRDFGASGIVISEHTYAALEELSAQFDLEPMGRHAFKGKREGLLVYRLLGFAAERHPAAAMTA